MSGGAATALLAWALGAGLPAAEGELRVATRGFAQSVPDEVLFSQIRTGTLASTTTASRVALQLHALGFVEGRPVPELGLRLGLDTASSSSRKVGRPLRGAHRREVGQPPARGDGLPRRDLARAGAWRDRRLRAPARKAPTSDRGRRRLRRLRLRSPGGRRSFVGQRRPGVDPGLRPPPGRHLHRAQQAKPVLRPRGCGAVGSARRASASRAVLVDGDDGAAAVLQDAIVRGGVERLNRLEGEVVPQLPPNVRPAAERGFDRLTAGLERLSQTTPLYLVSSSGWLGWTGATFRASYGDLRLQGVALVGMGELTLSVVPDLLLELVVERELGPIAGQIIDNQTRTGPVSILSLLGQVEAQLSLSSEVELRAFTLAMTR